mgnify:FL=1
MKRLWGISLLLGMLVLACGHAIVLAEENSSPISASGKTASAETFVVEKATRTATLTAFTRARNSMTLVSEVSARVSKVPLDVGDVIGKKGVFAYLDATFIKLDLARNRADQQRLKSDVTFYGKERKRYEDLVKQKTAAQSTLDSYTRDYATAKHQLRALQVEERSLLEQLSRHTLKGPAGWKVIERSIEPGEWVNVGDKVAELGRYDVLLVPFALSSGEYRALKSLGREVTLRLPDLGKTVMAHVERVSPGFDPETRKINVDLQIDSGELEFRGGIRTELTLHLPDPGGSVLVPESALVKAYEEHFLVTPAGKRVRVVLLGSGGEGVKRVTSPQVRPGDVFLKQPSGNSS